MTVSYTTNMNLGKPTIGNSYNSWGTELNDQCLDILDAAILSNNFSENAASHSGLNFYYKGGRILDNVTTRIVIAGFILLTNTAINYIEVSTAGTVSANTTSFTDGSIPLFMATTAGGVITGVTDKRAYMMPGSFFSLSGSTY